VEPAAGPVDGGGYDVIVCGVPDETSVPEMLGYLALLVGVAVLVLGIGAARRRGPRRQALALFALAWLPFAIAFAGKSLVETEMYGQIVRLGSDAVLKDVAWGLEIASKAMALGTVGLLAGLAGAAAALARSREDGLADPS
jgi:hypothetical protein